MSTCTGKHTTGLHTPTLANAALGLKAHPRKSMNRGLLLERETATFPLAPPGTCLKVGPEHPAWPAVGYKDNHYVPGAHLPKALQSQAGSGQEPRTTPSSACQDRERALPGLVPGHRDALAALELLLLPSTVPFFGGGGGGEEVGVRVRI